MRVTRSKLIELAQRAMRESKLVDFKRQFDVSSLESWCEVIKDIVAMANSGGGIIVFGVEDNGVSADIDPSPIFDFDPADISTKIMKYTGGHLHDIEVLEVTRGTSTHAAFLVPESEVPVIFNKPGTYEVADRKQKTAFGQGTIYFRHGSKSEHGSRDDLAAWRDREMAKARKSWLSGIRKVVEIAPGTDVDVFPAATVPSKIGAIVKASVSNDPSAVRFTPTNAGEIWPHRQVDVIRKVNLRLEGKKEITSHDILCIKVKYDIFITHPEFAYKPHKLASPQYSDAFIDWIINEYSKDVGFFTKARAEHAKKHLK